MVEPQRHGRFACERRLRRRGEEQIALPVPLAALVGLDAPCGRRGRSVQAARGRGTIAAVPRPQGLLLGRVRPPERRVGSQTAVTVRRVGLHLGLCARRIRRGLDGHLFAARPRIVGRGAGSGLHCPSQHHGVFACGERCTAARKLFILRTRGNQSSRQQQLQQAA